MVRKVQDAPKVVRGHGRHTGHLAKRKTAQVADAVPLCLVYTGLELEAGRQDMAPGGTMEGSTWSEEE